MNIFLLSLHVLTRYTRCNSIAITPKYTAATTAARIERIHMCTRGEHSSANVENTLSDNFGLSSSIPRRTKFARDPKRPKEPMGERRADYTRGEGDTLETRKINKRFSYPINYRRAAFNAWAAGSLRLFSAPKNLNKRYASKKAKVSPHLTRANHSRTYTKRRVLRAAAAACKAAATAAR